MVVWIWILVLSLVIHKIILVRIGLKCIGVEEVRADYKASRVVVKVKGKDAEPLKVCQRIEKKSGRKVKIISPLPNKEQEDDDNKQKENNDPEPIQASKQEVLFNFLYCILITNRVLSCPLPYVQFELTWKALHIKLGHPTTFNHVLTNL